MGDEDDEDDDDISHLFRRQGRSRPDPDRFPKVPSDEGAALMRSGTFGVNDTLPKRKSDDGTARRKKLARMILDRELAFDEPPRQRISKGLMSQVLLRCPILFSLTNPLGNDTFVEGGYGNPLQRASL